MALSLMEVVVGLVTMIAGGATSYGVARFVGVRVAKRVVKKVFEGDARTPEEQTEQQNTAMENAMHGGDVI